MAATTPVGMTAGEIARDVRDGTRAARDVVAAHLARIAAADEAVGAFQLVRHDAAMDEAGQFDALGSERKQLPLAGVPIAIKDNVPVRGEPMRLGSRASPTAPAAADHPVVTRLRAAGAIVIGVTRVPELCLWGTADNGSGTARTPWRLDRTAGGSSGGSGAAVAARMVPLAHGNDGLGSIRIPAACCGLVGIKPGRGVVPADLGPNSWFGIAENGALATTVADASLMLSVMADDEALADIHRPPRLRIALASAPPAIGVPADRELVERTRATASMLAHEGHEVVEVTPPMPGPLELLGILGTWGAGARDEVDALLGGDPAAWDLLEKRTRRHVRMGDVARRLGLASERHRASWRRRMDRFFERHDVLMTPTLAQPPIAADGWRHRGWLANLFANLTYTPYCGPVNFARLPAIAVPAGVHSDGTPASVHLVTMAGGERTLLGLAAEIERQRPWLRHPPDGSDRSMASDTRAPAG